MGGINVIKFNLFIGYAILTALQKNMSFFD